MPGPPVAKIVAIPGWSIKALVASILGTGIYCKAPFGKPAFSASSRMTSNARAEDFWAPGWKAKMIGLRVLMAISDLNMVVEVGFVTGVTPAITPIGSAIDTKPRCLSSLITPTVLLFLIECQISSVANMFLIALSSHTPRPVSSTASFANSIWWSKPAIAIRWTMWSIFSWSKVFMIFKAACAFATNSSTILLTSTSVAVFAVFFNMSLPPSVLRNFLLTISQEHHNRSLWFCKQFWWIFSRKIDLLTDIVVFIDFNCLFHFVFFWTIKANLQLFSDLEVF